MTTDTPLERLAELLARAMRPGASQPTARARLFALLLPKDREPDGLLPGLLSELTTLREEKEGWSPPLRVSAADVDELNRTVIAFDAGFSVSVGSTYQIRRAASALEGEKT